MSRFLLLIGLFLSINSVFAGKLLNSYVNEIDGHFVLHLDMRVNAKRKDIRSILMDFSKMPAVNKTVLESRLLNTVGDKYKIYFVSRGCLWIFCQTIKQVAMVSELDNEYIMSVVIAKESDLKYGRALWRLIDEGSTTRIIYDSDYVPDFWVPPLIGSAIVKDKMLSEGLKTINGLERVINQEKSGETAKVASDSKIRTSKRLLNRRQTTISLLK